MKLDNNQHQLLIETASQTLRSFKDYTVNNVSVASALLTGSGKIYSGVNIDSWSSTCAEQVAIGTALTNGERQCVCIVSVREYDGVISVVPPCGRCREMFAMHTPEIMVLLQIDGHTVAKTLDEMLPYRYTN